MPEEVHPDEGWGGLHPIVIYLSVMDEKLWLSIRGGAEWREYRERV